jgi:microcystin-dependent protein
MSDPYIGEIRVFGFNYPPDQWALCNGQLVAISTNTALFSILGTTFGGNGQQTFALPNFQGAAPMHWGAGAGLTPRVLGEPLGTPTVSLNLNEMPSHNHTVQSAEGKGAQNTGVPSAAVWPGESNPGFAYSDTTANLTAAFSSKAIGFSGGGAPHQNMQPFLTLNICIALYGIFPPRS